MVGAIIPAVFSALWIVTLSAIAGYARFVPLENDRGIVHNVYYLHASEMGWIGLLVFLLMTVAVLVVTVLAAGPGSSGSRECHGQHGGQHNGSFATKLHGRFLVYPLYNGS